MPDGGATVNSPLTQIQVWAFCVSFVIFFSFLVYSSTLPIDPFSLFFYQHPFYKEQC
jgi:hypothetical protein